ncbi:MAG: hypothetical protein BYD32DRAFT_422691, partial [Podila humilis]
MTTTEELLHTTLFQLFRPPKKSCLYIFSLFLFKINLFFIYPLFTLHVSSLFPLIFSLTHSHFHSACIILLLKASASSLDFLSVCPFFTFQCNLGSSVCILLWTSWTCSF